MPLYEFRLPVKMKKTSWKEDLLVRSWADAAWERQVIVQDRG